MTALDLDPELLAALEQRAAAKGVHVATLAADATDFELPHARRRSSPSRCRRSSCWATATGSSRRARRALVPGGRVAVAIATELDSYDGTPPLPVPDFGDHDGSTYISQPIAIRVDEDHVEIERIRQIVGAEGERTSAGDLIRLSVVTPGELAEEAAAHGLEAEELLHIPETLEHVASQVVVFRG